MTTTPQAMLTIETLDEIARLRSALAEALLVTTPPMDGRLSARLALERAHEHIAKLCETLGVDTDCFG